MARVALSIDWDYFVPEDPMLDMGHSENGFFINYIWVPRAAGLLAGGVNYKEKIKTNGKEKVFWEEIRKVFDIDNALVVLTESHAAMHQISLETEIDEVYSFDAHADLSYDRHGEDFQGEIDCGNWLGHLVSKEDIRKGYIIYSEETNERPEGDFKDLLENKALKNKVEFLKYDDLVKNNDGEKITVNLIHICRSGAWCPPWLDRDFYAFVERLGLAYFDAGIVERSWNEEIEQQIEEQAGIESGFLRGIKDKK